MNTEDLRVGDTHVMTTFHALPATVAAGIGDVTSNAKGSGARYNAGKAPLDLLPLRLMVDFYAALMDDPSNEQATPLQRQALAALNQLANFQETQKRGFLIKALRAFDHGIIRDIALVFDYGRRKYAAWNWAKGMPWTVPLACAARHLEDIILGQDNDAESGLPHRGHFGCNVAMLFTYLDTYTEGNDLPPVGMLAPVEIEA